MSLAILGSDYMADLPIDKLAAQDGIEEQICNRSKKNMTIAQALSALDERIISLQPSKVFVNLGESDLKSPTFDENEFIAKYEWLLYQIHSKTSALLYVVSVPSASSDIRKLNRLLKAKAAEFGCVYISLDHAVSSPQPEQSVFDELKPYFTTVKAVS